MLTVLNIGERSISASSANGFDIIKKNHVEIVKDIDGTYGIHYKFGSGYSINELAEMNKKCDTIIFYGHCTSLSDSHRTGPDVAFTHPFETDHTVKLIGTNSLYIREIASDLAKILRADFNDRIIKVSL